MKRNEIENSDVSFFYKLHQVCTTNLKYVFNCYNQTDATIRLRRSTIYHTDHKLFPSSFAVIHPLWIPDLCHSPHLTFSNSLKMMYSTQNSPELIYSFS